MRKLFLMCGPAGAGKSTFVSKMFEANDIHVSRDAIRFSMLKDGDDYNKYAKEEFKEFIRQLNEALASGVGNVYADATHLTEKARNKVLDRLDIPEGVEIVPVNFLVSEDICLAHNALRSGRAFVPEFVIRNMCEIFKPAKKGEKHEYADILWVSYYKEKASIYK